MNNNPYPVQSMPSVPTQAGQQPAFEARCKTGKLRVTNDGMLCLFPVFSKSPAWQATFATLKKFTVQAWGFSFNVLVHTTSGTYQIEALSKANFEKLHSLFPGAQLVTAPRGGLYWYVDIRKRTHVATYKNQRVMQREVEKSSQHGWTIQTSTGIAGHRNLGTIVAGGLLLGPIGALAGAGRSKDKITLTYVRTPEWLAQNG
jgi:hypothetical protein